MAVYRFTKSRQGNNLVSDHFRVSEFACHDGSDEVLIDVDLVFKLEVLRQKFGRPMVISSGYRTPSWNKKVGGKSGSYHVKGQAFDIVTEGVEPYDVAHAAQGLWINGIGCYYDDGFVHIDARKNPSFWKNQTVTPVETFENLPALGCTPKNLRLALMADGRTFPEHGISDGAQDSEFMNALKATAVKRGGGFSNAAKIVPRTVGANPDGIPGSETEAKIRAWQRANGLYADGIFGINCFKKALGI